MLAMAPASTPLRSLSFSGSLQYDGDTGRAGRGYSNREVNRSRVTFDRRIEGDGNRWCGAPRSQRSEGAGRYAKRRGIYSLPVAAEITLADVLDDQRLSHHGTSLG